MLGSVVEADDALQEAWLRIRDQDPGNVENMQAWLTTVVGRVCLNMLRSRRARREEFSDARVPDPVVTFANTTDPEQEALLADSVGLALLVVLDALSPAERLAFVLHDVFGVPFSDIATVLDRSEAAAQQLASRARRRVQGSPEPDPDLARQRERSSTRSSPLREMATSTHSSPYSIPTSNFESMAARYARKPRSFFVARKPSPPTLRPIPTSTPS
jgi:RNA polymerase sigma factor (sigma-70 family)